MTTQYKHTLPDDPDGTPYCQYHLVRMIYSHPFIVDGKTIHVWACPFDNGHLEFRDHGIKPDDEAAATIAA